MKRSLFFVGMGAMALATPLFLLARLLMMQRARRRHPILVKL